MRISKATPYDMFRELRLVGLRQMHGLLFLPLEWPEFNARAKRYFRALCSERVG